ncbi:helix-turn-helix domain-containing protein [Actinoplanes sp. NPDC049316]|uniref:IclR family transcriptional regulator n=1 Tax=Actinoplanes sp. NPDC049316 TaxID=3154727 RepID=UPI00341BB05C
MASRLLRVLDAFSAARPELSLADISRTTGLPSATLYRLLRELTDHGAIQRTSTGRYAVGLRLWEIGRLAPAVSRLDEVAVPYLAALYEATHGASHLAVPLGAEALCVVAISGLQTVQPVLPAGARVPLESPGIGRVLLAYASPDVLAEVLEGGGRSTYRIRQELVEIRRSGVAVTGVGSRSFSVAAPLVGPHGAVMAAVSVAVRTTGDSLVLIRMVRRAAARISRELGTSADAAVPGL